MARFVDRRTFLRRSALAGAGVLGAPLLRPSRAVAAGDRLVVAVGQWGIETPFAWRSEQSEKCLWDHLRPADPARLEDLGVSSGAGHRVEALERSQGVDVQAPIGREVPRELGRADRRGREVHRRAEHEARRARRHGAVLPRDTSTASRPRQAHGRDALQRAGCGTCRRCSASSSATRTHFEEVSRDSGRGEGGAPSDRHRALPAHRRASRGTITVSRRCPTTGARRRRSRRW